jgi:hypothetical protein
MIKRLITAIRTKGDVPIEFLCYENDYDVIAPPVPARKILPQWFKDLPPKMEGQNKLQNSTIKRCMPVLDALSAGWIIPLAADVEFVTNGDATEVQTKSLFYRTLVETHNKAQVAGHPESPKTPFKFLNYWAIKLPPGYSMLFMPPLNRYEPRFECFSGMVDDTYMGTGAMEFINFPFFFKQPNYTGIIKKGTPLVQCIPIKREPLSHEIKPLRPSDEELIEKTRRRYKTHESMYRDELRQPK